MTPNRKARSASGGALWSGKALFAVFVWGASFVATRIALESFTPVGLVAVRMVLGAAVLVAAGIVTRRSILPAASDLPVALLLGALLGGHSLIQAIGLRYTSAINAGWIIGFSPVPIALGGWLLLKQRLGAAAWAGFVVATAGVVLIIATTTPGFVEARTGDVLQVFSCFTWALYTLAGAGAVARNGALRVTVPAIAGGAITLAAAVPWSGVLHHPLTASSATAVSFLGILCTGAGFLLWYSVLREHGAARAGSYLYLEPFVTLAVSAALLGEPISASVVAGGVLVLAGVWAVARGSVRPAIDVEASIAEAS